MPAAMLRRRNVNRSTQRLGLLAHNYGNPQIFSFLFIFFHRARMGKLNAKRPLAPRNVVLGKTFFIKHSKLHLGLYYGQNITLPTTECCSEQILFKSRVEIEPL